MAADDDRSTRDLVIGLVKDVQHMREQLDKVLKLEDRMLVCEKVAQESRDYAARLAWLVGGVLVVAVPVLITAMIKLVK